MEVWCLFPRLERLVWGVSCDRAQKSVCICTLLVVMHENRQIYV